jgi:hypothetical protein
MLRYHTFCLISDFCKAKLYFLFSVTLDLGPYIYIKIYIINLKDRRRTYQKQSTDLSLSPFGYVIGAGHNVTLKFESWSLESCFPSMPDCRPSC